MVLRLRLASLRTTEWVGTSVMRRVEDIRRPRLL